jgi:hypothetical protein
VAEESCGPLQWKKLEVFEVLAVAVAFLAVPRLRSEVVVDVG